MNEQFDFFLLERRISTLEKDVKKLTEEHVPQKTCVETRIPKGWITTTEFSKTYLFVSHNHISCILKDNLEFFKEDCLFVKNTRYFNPFKFLEFIYKNKCGKKTKFSFLKMVKALPSLQKLNEDYKKKQENICL